MTRIEWGQEDRLYEYGVDRGVLYLSGDAVPWNGLTGVDETSNDGSVSSVYFDGVKTVDILSKEEFSLHVKAFVYPEEFEDRWTRFGFSYRTSSDNGSKIHLVYNVTAAPSGRTWTSKMETIDPSEFEWDLSTMKTKLTAFDPTAHLIIDTKDANADAIEAIEDLIYGTVSTDPTLPTPDEVVAIFEAHALLVVTINGDGTWTATGPDEAFEMLDANTFAITWPSVKYLSPNRYQISTY